MFLKKRARYMFERERARDEAHAHSSACRADKNNTTRPLTVPFMDTPFQQPELRANLRFRPLGTATQKLPARGHFFFIQISVRVPLLFMLCLALVMSVNISL